MRTLLITDLHINSRVPGLCEAQYNCLRQIVLNEAAQIKTIGENYEIDDFQVIIMGDVFMYRRPSPSDLLWFNALLKDIHHVADDVVVLRGNHDSETKADDGITALSVFEDDLTRIIKHTYIDDEYEQVYIPHYEDEVRILEALQNAPKGYDVFGHFGYAGRVNSRGDEDSSLALDRFNNRTYLGHIHGFCTGQGASGDAVLCLGTQYTTNFGEAFKSNYYCILEDGEPRFEEVTSGPRHLIYSASDIPGNLDTINDPNYFTFLRIIKEDEDSFIPYDDINVASIDIQYAPVFNEEVLSDYSPKGDVFAITGDIIEDYIENANTTLPKDKLREGYKLLKDEN